MNDTAGQRSIHKERNELVGSEKIRHERWCEYLDATARGQSQALAALYDESSSLVFSVAKRILHNTADAEEITLDVYVYIWRSGASFDSSRASVATWLVMLTRSRAIDRLRSIALRSQMNLGGNLLSSPIALSNESSNRVYVARAMEQLDSADRELMELVFYSGLSHSELATRLQTPLGTVKSRVRMALVRLRKLMGGS